MSAHSPGQKQASFSLSQLPTFIQHLEQYNFSHSWIRMKTAVSGLEPFPSLDAEEERGGKRSQKGQGPAQSWRTEQPPWAIKFLLLSPCFTSEFSSCFLRGNTGVLPTGLKSCSSRKKQPEVLLWLIKGCIAPPALFKGDQWEEFGI